jgi:dephospho-CoA kinase
MRLIGVTGGIATGKSTVDALLVVHGAEVIDADELAREVVAPGEPALAEVARRFGAAILQPGGTLDRARLGAVVFADPVARRDLEAITHPRITTLMQERIAQALAGAAPLVAVDIPLLYENGRESLFEGVLVVYAPQEVQVRRMFERNGLDAAAATQRLAAQLPIDEKRGRATWVIDNSGDLETTAAAVDTWWGATVR